MRVHLAGGAAEDQSANGVPRGLDVGVASQDVDLLVGEHDAGSRGVFDGGLGFAFLSGNAADAPGQVIAMQGFDWRLGEGMLPSLISKDSM